MRIHHTLFAIVLVALSCDVCSFSVRDFFGESAYFGIKANKESSDMKKNHSDPLSISDKMTSMLKDVFPDKARIDTMCTDSVNNAVAQKAAENEFLLRKVITLKKELEELRNFDASKSPSTAAFNEMVELNSQLKSENAELKVKLAQLYEIVSTYEHLREENAQLRKKLSEWDAQALEGMAAAAHKAALEETVLNLDNKIKTLKAEKAAMQRSLDLLPLICLLVNVVLLITLGSTYIFPEGNDILNYLSNFIDASYVEYSNKRGMAMTFLEKKLNASRYYKIMLHQQEMLREWVDEQLRVVSAAVVATGRRAYNGIRLML